MNYLFHPYLIPLAISAAVMFALAVYGYRNRETRGGTAFALGMLTGAVWAGANALEMSAAGLAAKLFWANLQYLSYTFSPLCWLVVVFYFTDETRWINRKNLIILSIIPVITNILVWTNGWHGLLRQNVYLDAAGSFAVIAKDYGAWFWVHSFYSYLLNLYTIYLLIKTIFSKNRTYIKQVFFLLTGLGLVMVFNLLYILGLSPVSRFDLTPIIFSISGIIITWGIFRFKLLDLMPIARQTIIEKMNTGIIVMDSSLRIMDYNPRAAAILGFEQGKSLGQTITDIPWMKGIVNEGAGTLELTKNEIALERNGSLCNYELNISPIKDNRDILAAWVLLIYDITELKMAREAMYRQQQELAVMNEREWIARELHDNLSQVIHYIKTQTTTVKSYLDRDMPEKAAVHLERLYSVVQESHTEIRSSISRLQGKSQHWSFISQLEDYLKGFSTAHGFVLKEGSSANNQSFKLPEDRGYQLYRIILEALNNAVKHSDPGKIRLEIKQVGRQLTTLVKDDGCGFEPELVDKPGCFGLDTMQERARACQGNLQIESSPGRGTAVRVEIPYSDGVNGVVDNQAAYRLLLVLIRQEGRAK